MYRLFGIEFKPFESNLTSSVSQYDVTGFKMGERLAINRGYPDSLALFGEMGIDPNSLAAYNFEESVKWGEPGAHDFVRDFLAGFDRASGLIRETVHHIHAFNAANAHIARRAMFECNALLEKIQQSLSTSADFTVNVKVRGVDMNDVVMFARDFFAPGSEDPNTYARLMSLQACPVLTLPQGTTEEGYRVINHALSQVLIPELCNAVESMMYNEFRQAGVSRARGLLYDQRLHSSEPLPNVYLDQR